MSTFTTLHTVSTITNSNGINVDIVKVKKDGTQRTFFRPVTADGVKIGSTVWARLYEAERTAKTYLKNK